MINQLSLLVAIVSLLFVFQEPEVKPAYVSLIQLVIPVVLAGVPLFNSLGYYSLAKYLLYIGLNLGCLFGASWTGFAGGGHLFFIPVVASTALLFDLRKLKTFFSILAISLLSIFLLFWLDDKMAIDQQVYAEELKQIYLQNFFTTIVASFLLAYIYYRITDQQQSQLKQAIQKHTELNTHLRRSEKKLQKTLLFSNNLMERLRDRNTYFKALLQNATDVTAVVDAEGYFKYVTPSFFRLTGFKPDEMADKTVFDFVHPDEQTEALSSFQRNLEEDGRQSILRFRYRKIDGTYMFMEAKGTNLLNEKNVQGIIINSRDISDRLHYEEQVQEKEKNIRTILDNNDNRIWLLDREYRLLDFNAAFADDFAAYFGNPLQRNINIFDLLPVEVHAEWRRRYKAAEDGATHSYTDQFALAQGERVFRITIYPIMEDGRLERITVFSKDITEQEQAEQALIEAKEKAEEATQAKAQFLSTMSHEIRTPMNAVIGMTHLLLQDTVTPDQAENLRILKFSAENLLVLINDILDFSKIEAGKISFESTPFNLPELVSDLKQSMMPAAREKNISLEVLQDTDLPDKVTGDSVRLSQILINLLSNAIKFTEKGGVKVQLTVLEDAPDASLIQFKVSDTGIGVPRHMQEAIFESFTQGSSDTTRRFGGTGLGLAITKRLLELQGSKIELESKEGEGSEFSFSLRFEKPDAAKKNMQEQSRNNRLQEFSLRGKRILMVEDNPLNIFIGRKYLEKWGVDLQTAENGVQALEMLRQQTFDLILMDLQMPEMNGYEATRQIRRLENPKIAKLPILAISAAVEQEVRQKALEAGFNDFVVKPFNPEKLLKQLSRYLALQLKV